MQPRLSKKYSAAMTLVEVLVVTVMVVILAVVLLPMLAAPKMRAPRIYCLNNIKQIGLSYRLWEADNNGIYPQGISVTNGGSMEMAATGNVAQTFLVMSNILTTPKILFCPSDRVATEATSFTGLANANISYFVSMDVTNNANPQMIISGDSNFEIGGVPVKSGLLQLGSNASVAWTAARHKNAGNIGLTDDSVQSETTTGLQNYLRQTGLATNRLAIP